MKGGALFTRRNCITISAPAPPPLPPSPLPNPPPTSYSGLYYWYTANGASTVADFLTDRSGNARPAIVTSYTAAQLGYSFTSGPLSIAVDPPGTAGILPNCPTGLTYLYGSSTTSSVTLGMGGCATSSPVALRWLCLYIRVCALPTEAPSSSIPLAALTGSSDLMASAFAAQ